jgi:hypothetical protein
MELIVTSLIAAVALLSGRLQRRVLAPGVPAAPA